MTVELATEVFARGFTFTRSFTHPYHAELLEPGVWALRDAPRTRGAYRGEEHVSCGELSPEAFAALARHHTRGKFRLCVIQPEGADDTTLRADFRALGYRLMTTEAFMEHGLDDIKTGAEPYPIVQVTTEAQADLLAKTAGTRQILTEHLAARPAPMRQYMALDGDVPVGWVGSVIVQGSGWCSNMFVAPPYRRRGIARSLLTRMLTDDKAAGLTANVLLSSHAGSKLYPTVGYVRFGTLLMFTPPKTVK